MRGVGEKCTFCTERLDRGLMPACVEACTEKAMYFGDLEAVFGAARGVLRDGGHCVCSVEKGEAEGFRLRSTGRYQHHPEYVRVMADGVGLETLYNMQ